jgi:hypothetical protein
MASTAIDRLDGVSSSVAVKAPVYAVTSGPIALSGWQTIGGVDLEDLARQGVSPRVLVKDQIDGRENGIYDASSGNWTRSKDFDGNRDVVRGTTVPVKTDTTDQIYIVASDNPIVIGSSSIEFELRYGANVRYDQTPAEIAAGVTPVDYGYIELHAKRMGAAGDGSQNDTNAFEDLIGVANEYSRATIVLPRGHYKLDKLPTISQGIAIVGESRDSVILDFSDSEETLDNGAFLYSEGDGLTPLPALAADVSRFSKNIEFASAPDLVAGDLLHVYDTADSSYSGFRPEYRAGEFLQVMSVSGTTVTLTTYPFATYDYTSLTVGIEKVSNPTRASFSNFTIRGRGGNDYPLRVKYSRGGVISNVAIENNTRDALSCSLSYDMQLDRIKVDCLNTIGSDLVRGLSIHNSQNISVSNSILAASRHGLNLGGSETKGIVNRRVTVTGCVIRNASGEGSVNSVSTHGNSEHVSFVGCHLDGITLGGDFNSVKSCDIRGNANRGLHFAEITGLNHEIKGNRVTINKSADTSRGVFVDIAGSSDDFNANTVNGGTLVIRGNMFRYLSPDDAVDGIFIRNRGCTAPMHIVIDDNEFEGAISSVGHQYAVFIEKVSGDDFDSITVTNNKRMNGWGINVNDTAYAEISGNNPANGRNTGILGAELGVVRCNSNNVTGFQADGINLDNASGAASQICYLYDNIVRENNITTNGTQNSVLIRRFATVFSSRNVYGSSQTGAARPVAYHTLTTLYELMNTDVGTGSPTYSSVSTRIPSAVSDGSSVDTLLAQLRAASLLPT